MMHVTDLYFRVFVTSVEPPISVHQDTQFIRALVKYEAVPSVLSLGQVIIRKQDVKGFVLLTRW